MKKFEMPPVESYLEDMRSSVLPPKLKQAILQADLEASKHPSSLEQQRKQARQLRNRRNRMEGLDEGNAGAADIS